MFERAALQLLAGHFVCEVTAPEAYRWLSDPDNRAEIDQYLQRIGRRLASTANQRAYFSAWSTIGQDERTEARRHFAQIKHDISPVVQFITFCMDTTRHDAAPSAGEALDYAFLLKSIADSAHLGEQLRTLANLRSDLAGGDGSTRALLDRMLRYLEKQGYLLATQRGGDSYRFTGKIEYLYEVVDFLTLYEPELQAGLNKADEAELGRLL